MKPIGFGRRFAGLVALAAISMAGTRLALAQSSPLPKGNVGLGTYNTIAQFKDLEVTVDGKVVLHKSLAEGMADLQVSGGQWSVVDGALQQGAMQTTGLRVFTGDKEWTDYTVSVKARKISGNEGFYLIFRATDERNMASFTVGGAGNTKAHLSMRVNNNYNEIGDSTPMSVEENRWYDVKVEVKGDEATGYLDGKKVAQGKLLASAANPAPAAARRGPTPGTAPARSGATPAVAATTPAGGGGTKVATPAVAAKPTAEPMSMRDKMIYGGAATIVIGLVIVWALQFRKPPASNPK